MNIVVTLPKELIKAIIEGRKVIEIRKFRPTLMKVGDDGFYCVEKGTQFVRCWCRVDDIGIVMKEFIDPKELARKAAVSEEFIKDYIKNGRIVYLWRIGKVRTFENDSFVLSSLNVDRNPQKFAYCVLLHGESY